MHPISGLRFVMQLGLLLGLLRMVLGSLIAKIGC